MIAFLCIAIGTLTLTNFVGAQFGEPCLIYGPDFPAPSNPSKDSAVIAANVAIQKAIQNAFANKEPYGALDPDGAALSIDIYSGNEEDSIYTFHHTPVAYFNATHGVRQVDSDTVYRLGSISKLLTIYLFLMEAGDTSWNNPVTDYIPELASMAQKQPVDEANEINYVDWTGITVGALASQLAGVGSYITQDPKFDDEYDDPSAWPPPDDFEQRLCGANGYASVGCNRTEFFQNFLERPPVVAPFQTAIYSNAGFAIFGYVLEATTKRAQRSIFHTDLVERLGLNRTYFTAPESSNTSIIPISPSFSRWRDDLRMLNAAGGFYSSINDLRKIGCSMLNSTYLTKAQTRRWFQPHSFNADPRGAIGAPFEMIRAPFDGKLVWVYTKSGSYGAYSTLVGYLPDYKVGFTILTAWSSSVGAVEPIVVGNILISLLVPALEAAAKAEATMSYVGKYAYPTYNSSMVIEADQYTGLSLTQWLANGTDVRAQMLAAAGLPSTAFARLVPTGLTNSVGGRTVRTSWRIIRGELLENVTTQPVSSLCYSWALVDALTYGRYGLDSIIFDLGADGVAMAVEPAAFREIWSRI